jgi:hypothetical protein
VFSVVCDRMEVKEWQLYKDLEWVSPLKFCMLDLCASIRVLFWAYKICNFCGVDV